MTQPDYPLVGLPEARTGRPVLAVGWPLGFQVDVGSGDVPERPYVVRRGSRFIDLPESAYRIWTLAFGGASRQELITAAELDGLDDAGEIVAALFRAETLVELDDDPLGNERLFEDLRLLPIGVVEGNSAESPNEFNIALPGLGLRAVVDFRVYRVYSLSDGARSIAEACRRLAQEASDLEAPVDPRYVIGQVAINLRLLVRQGVARLDLK